MLCDICSNADEDYVWCRICYRPVCSECSDETGACEECKAAEAAKGE